MSRVLFTWELGAHYGHLSRQIPVAGELRRRGHEVLFAVGNLAAAQELLAPAGIGFIAGPNPPMQNPWPVDSVAYVDLLARSGFGELPALRATVSAWKHLFTVYRPDVIVADHAPASLLAARLANIPVVHVAIGFELPTASPGLPILRRWEKPNVAEVAEREGRVLADVNQVCLEHGALPLSNLGDLFDTEVPLLATFPELDHFPWRKNGRYIGPVLSWREGKEATWSGSGVRKIFLYQRPDDTLDNRLRILGQMDAEVIAVVPGLDVNKLSELSSSRLRLFTEPLRLDKLLRQADVAVIPGGHGMICASLLSGVPMLMLPVYLEQMLVATRAEDLGAGIGLRPAAVTDRFKASLDKLLGEARYREAAADFAHKYREFDQAKVINRLANTVERLPSVRQSVRAQKTSPTPSSAAALH